MKKVQFVAVLVTFLVYGCSERMSPVGPEQTTSVQPGQSSSAVPDPSLATATTTDTTTRKTNTILPTNIQTVVGDLEMVADPNVITTSVRVAAKNGGSVGLKGKYTGTGGVIVTYDLSINFLGGALPQDTLISITIDKATFQENGIITFGPCGLVFNSPGALSVKCKGVSIAEGSTPVRLYYLNNGVFEPMPDSWGTYAMKDPTTGDLKAGANVPHFSRYAFGR